MNSFETAVLRVQETGMGILVYTVVNVVLWPQDSFFELNDAACKLLATQGKLFSAYARLMMSKDLKDEFKAVRLDEVKLINQFRQALHAARSDSYEVWELRRQWDFLENLDTRLLEKLEHWRESLPEVKHLNLAEIFPDLEVFFTNMEARFSQIEGMLAGKAPGQSIEQVPLTLNRAQLEKFTNFEKAAIAVVKTHLISIESLSRTLSECIQDIKGFCESFTIPASHNAKSRSFGIDVDRATGVVKVVIIMWLAYFIWIYTLIPGGTGFITIAIILGMSFANAPYLKVTSLIIPVIWGCALGSFLNLLIMPHLSSFYGLGLLIFAATFMIAYMFSEPRKALGRAMGFALFLNLISVVNVQQSYSFLTVANISVMFALVILLFVVTAEVPLSTQPEKVFIRLLRRFFREAEYVMSCMPIDWEPGKGIAERWKMLVYCENMLALSQKMKKWGEMINYQYYPETTKPQVDELVVTLEALACRIRELEAVGKLPQADLLVRELSSDVRAWRLAIQQLFNEWSTDPAFEHVNDLQVGLAKILTNMEPRINKTLSLAQKGELVKDDYINFYRIIGCYRSLSEAIIDHQHASRKISWNKWKEARF